MTIVISVLFDQITSYLTTGSVGSTNTQMCTARITTGSTKEKNPMLILGLSVVTRETVIARFTVSSYSW